MIYKVEVINKAFKELEAIKKSSYSDFERISIALSTLQTIDNPQSSKNATKLRAYKDNRYRWRVGDYRIIGKVEKEKITITIIKIAHRQGAYKGS